MDQKTFDEIESDKARMYCETIPKCQLAWDSTSLRAFMTCPRLYQYQIIEGWQPKHQSPALVFGIAFHRGLEVYESHRAKDEDHSASLLAGVRAALESWGDFQSDDNRRTAFTLVRGLVWYTDKWMHDPAKTAKLKNGKPAVELSFRVALPLASPDGTPYFVCGHMDRIVDLGGPRVSDCKTTVSTLNDNYFSKYELDVQIDLYDLFATIALAKPSIGVMIDGVQTAVNFTRFNRFLVDKVESERQEFFTELQYWIKQAEECAIQEYWPMNKTSCAKFGGCRYAEVCKKSPAARNLVLEDGFKIEKWNPLESRGD